MRKLILYICILSTTLGFGQVEFSITEAGMTPESVSSKMGDFTVKELYSKTLSWIKENSETHNLTIDHTVENASIHISFLKGNATNLDKRYYNANYIVNLSFGKEQFTFEPIGIRLKLNSKYDMGWKEFDLSNGAPYFKKGKAIRKYKSYLEGITKSLNAFYLMLHIHLKSEEN
ncbi:MAG: hypothetical protein AAGA43_03605 [Bacteroidota bacterium]